PPTERARPMRPDRPGRTRSRLAVLRRRPQLAHRLSTAPSPPGRRPSSPPAASCRRILLSCRTSARYANGPVRSGQRSTLVGVHPMIRKGVIPPLTLTLLIALVGAAQSGGPSDGKVDYRVVPSWARIPADVTLGPVSAVATDASDRVFVCHRGKKPVLVFNSDGTFVRSWGDEHLKTPHGLRIDREGHVWLTDIG